MWGSEKDIEGVGKSWNCIYFRKLPGTKNLDMVNPTLRVFSI